MTGEEIQRAIIQALAFGALNTAEVAREVGEPLFYVRTGLKALKRDRLVCEQFRARGVMWELTGRGYERAFATRQLKLGGGS